MKNISVIITLSLCFAFSDGANAQRYLPGQRGIQVTMGTINGFFHFHTGAAMATYTKKGNRCVFGGEYLRKHFEYGNMQIPQAQFTVDGGYYLKFLSDGSKTLFFSLGASVVAGYETVNWGKKLLPDGAILQNADGFLLGAALTLETEVYLTDWWVLLINVRERILSGSSVGKFNTQLGLGFKFIIN